MNVGVPFMVAENFRDSRIVVFSTACVYPFAHVDGGGAADDGADAAAAGRLRHLLRRRASRLSSMARSATARPGRLMRLEYAIDMRYGVLHDVARKSSPESRST